MPADQFNLRLRYGLPLQVRVRAAELGVNPRDIIEDALEIAGFQKITETGDPGPNQLRLSSPERVDIAHDAGRPDQPAGVTPSDAAHRDEDRRPSRRRESGDQRAADPGTPRQRSGRKDPGDTGAEGAKSGRGGRGATQRTPTGVDPAASHPIETTLDRGCPECGGELHLFADYPGPDGPLDVYRCEDCSYTEDARHGS